MSKYIEFKSQIAFGLMQVIMITVGSLITGSILKVFETTARPAWPMCSFVRDWGFLFLLLPVIYVIATTLLEQYQPDSFSKRGTIISGITLLLALVLFFFITSIAATGGPPPIRIAV